MAITSEIIGKLGGADVESVDVSMSGTGRDVEHAMTRVQVPAGKQVLVSLIGAFSSTQSSSSGANFKIGGFVSPAPATVGAHASASAILTSSGDVAVITPGSVGVSTFSGTVYTVEM